MEGEKRYMGEQEAKLEWEVGKGVVVVFVQASHRRCKE